jgi:exopolyphosphatase / guanosine-5'-triphosphate,3'-diphosphate pyrophosphatase
MTRVAAIDCGTNSLRLLVADVADGQLVDVVREMRIVRLGQDVDRTGRLADEALERTFDALAEFAALARDLHAQRIRMCATSATRDADNSDDFVVGCIDVLGVPPEIISGEQEAALSFRGATATLPREVFAPPYLVFDIGGGSTEFVLGDVQVKQSISVDLGCVRLTERALVSHPPTAVEIDAGVAIIDAQLDVALAAVDASAARTLVGLAGSVTTVAALALGLSSYDPQATHHHRMSYADVRRVTDDLLARTPSQRREYAVMHPGRADVIGAGALILRRIMERTAAAEVVASETDILDGIALSMA